MNWILVLYPRRRSVFLDGEFIGYTNRKLFVGEAGTYTVDLGDNKNYTPTEMTVRISRTTRRKPLELTFTANWR